MFSVVKIEECVCKCVRAKSVLYDLHMSFSSCNPNHLVIKINSNPPRYGPDVISQLFQSQPDESKIMLRKLKLHYERWRYFHGDRNKLPDAKEEGEILGDGGSKHHNF